MKYNTEIGAHAPIFAFSGVCVFLILIYDATEVVIGMHYHANTYEEDEWDVYRLEKNLLGDIVAIYDNAENPVPEPYATIYFPSR